MSVETTEPENTAAIFAVRDGDERPALHVYQPLGFAEPPEWAPFLPVAGIYDHPIYGKLNYTNETLDQYVANFKSGAYQSMIPVNCEHDVQASGAVGWITDMRRGEDGGVDARVEWNNRGKALIAEDRFRYVSAEVYDVWTDPVTGVDIPNVAVGLAICTNPYFKESVLRPLAASEAVITRVDAPPVAVVPEPVIEAVASEEPRMSDKEETPTSTTTAPPADPIVAELSEATRREVAELREAMARTQRDAQKHAEENARLRAAGRVNLFTDEVRGKSEHNGTAYIGHIPDHVKMLCNLAEKFGPDSWEVTFYQEQNRSHAEQMKAGNLYREIGTGRGGENRLTAEDQINARADEMVKANPKLSHAQAFTQVLTSDSELRAAHARERRGGQ